MNRSHQAGLVGGIASATLLVGALVAGAAAPAFAADPTPTPTSTPSSTPMPTSTAHSKTLAAIQAEAKIKTGKRIASLGTAITKVTADKTLTDSDRATILKTLNADLDGMKSTESTIAADTDAAAAAKDYATIFTAYRVYAVALPQSRAAAAADRMTSTAIPRLTTAQKKLSDALAGKFASKSTDALQADLADMTKQIDAASALLDGLAADALAVTPATYNSNHDVMKPIRADIATAVADLKKAHADGKTVAAAIRK